MKYIDHKVGSVIAGLIFSVGWWILIDGVTYRAVVEPDQPVVPWYAYIPAVAVSICLVCLNLVSLDDLNPMTMFMDDGVAMKVKIWLFLWYLIGAGCVAGGITVFAVLDNDNWTGVSILLQPIIVMAAATILLFVRQNKEDDDAMMI